VDTGPAGANRRGHRCCRYALPAPGLRDSDSAKRRMPWKSPSSA